MELKGNQYDYSCFTSESTGSLSETGGFKTISCAFGRYSIKIKLTPDNEFLEIVEVGINKDFLRQEQKIGIQGYHDVDQYYVDK